MSDLALRVDQLGKSYRIAHAQPGQTAGRYKTLQEDLLGLPRGLWTAVRGRNGARRETVWALKDVSFEVKQGEVLGIIGRNGAGKSTLLKILSRIAEPTEGHAEVYGRVGSLLEVGTGFHSELTGRENIFLNGAVLGMRRTEIARKFDEIVTFSGVEKFIDTPVKRYSSGMYLRLAFAVAAHLDPEILLVDEVLAVGDAEFQRKCLDKMKDVTREGRTVLFVSHNMAAVRSLCERTLLIDQGQIVLDGSTDAAVNQYLGRNLVTGTVVRGEELDAKAQGHLFHGQTYFRCNEIMLQDRNGEPRDQFESDEDIVVSILYDCFRAVPTFRLVVEVVNNEGVDLLQTENLDDPSNYQFISLNPGSYRSECILSRNLFGENSFFVTVWLIYQDVQHVKFEKILKLDIKFKGFNNNFSIHSRGKAIRPKLEWRTQEVSALQREKVA